jgi:hypothetical protein
LGVTDPDERVGMTEGAALPAGRKAAEARDAGAETLLLTAVARGAAELEYWLGCMALIAPLPCEGTITSFILILLKYDGPVTGVPRAAINCT